MNTCAMAPGGATAANAMDISPSVSLGALSENRMGSFAALKMSLRQEHHRLRDGLRQQGTLNRAAPEIRNHPESHPSNPEGWGTQKTFLIPDCVLKGRPPALQKASGLPR